MRSRISDESDTEKDNVLFQDSVTHIINVMDEAI